MVDRTDEKHVNEQLSLPDRWQGVLDKNLCDKSCQ